MRFDLEDIVAQSVALHSERVTIYLREPDLICCVDIDCIVLHSDVSPEDKGVRVRLSCLSANSGAIAPWDIVHNSRTEDEWEGLWVRKNLAQMVSQCSIHPSTPLPDPISLYLRVDEHLRTQGKRADDVLNGGHLAEFLRISSKGAYLLVANCQQDLRDVIATELERQAVRFTAPCREVETEISYRVGSARSWFDCCDVSLSVSATAVNL
jgi:hypothetical protein